MTFVSVAAVLFASGAMIRSWMLPPDFARPLALAFEIVMIGSIWFVATLFLRSPMLITVVNDMASLSYLWRRRVQVPLRQLRRKHPPGLASQLTGADDVVDSAGRLAFRIWPGLIHSQELTRLIPD